MCVFAKLWISGKSPATVARARIAVAARETARVSAILIVIGAACIAETPTGLASPLNEAMTRPEAKFPPRHYGRGSSEPFGLPTLEAPHGALVTKWRHVETEIRRDELLVARCAMDPRTCGSVAALRLLAIVDVARRRTGRARVGEVNRAINLAIRPMSDLAQYGVSDLWTAPIQTLTAGAGDCEDYAIAKYVALREAGIADEDLRLVVLRDTRRREDHSVVAVRLDGRWLVLDNRWLAIVEDVQLKTYVPVFVMDHDGVRRFLVPARQHVLAREATGAARAQQPLDRPS